MLEFLTRHKTKMPSAEEALSGRANPIVEPGSHAVLKTPIGPPFPEDTERVIVGLGCFWGAERLFWQLPGVHTTAAGYSAGYTPNPTYEEVCSARTGHNEVVLVVFRPAEISYDEILRTFWEGHDPTQGMRQGNDVGSQYRSGIYTTTEAQQAAARASKETFAAALQSAGHGEITTEVLPAGDFYYAEEYHQQYLAKNPSGYCGLGGTGVACPIGLATSPRGS